MRIGMIAAAARSVKSRFDGLEHGVDEGLL